MTKPLTPEEVNAILVTDWGTLHLADGTLFGEVIGPVQFEWIIPMDNLLYPSPYPFKISGPFKFPKNG